jgi:hypothetical protein
VCSVRSVTCLPACVCEHYIDTIVDVASGETGKALVGATRGEKQDRYEQSARTHISSTARTMTKANSTSRAGDEEKAREEALCTVLYDATRRVGLGSEGWRLLLRSRLDYAVLARVPPHSHDPVGTDDGFWVLEQRQSSKWAGQYGVVVPLEWGVLPCRISFRYPRRLRIGSRRQGRGRGWFVDCDSSVKARESQSGRLSV